MHLRRHEYDIDVITEVGSIILHDAEQESMGQAQRGSRLHAGKHSRVQARLVNATASQPM